MLFSPRINLKQLAGLSRRLATSTSAGVDIRKTWKREAEQAPLRLRTEYREISDAVHAGQSMSDGLARTGNCFPRLFREMVDVGEKSRRLPEVLSRLATHYEHLSSMRRSFLASLAWPMFQLLVAVLVVGLLIWIMSFLPRIEGSEPLDLLGFGLIGTPGLITYFSILGCVVAAVVVLVWAMRRGYFWIRPLQLAIMRVPVLGGVVETMALAQLTWSLHLALDSTMSLRDALPLALRSTNNAHYTRHSQQVVADVVGGYDIHEAFARTGAFPSELVSIVEVGQNTGMLAESMGRLSHEYQDRARVAAGMLARLLGMAIWALVAMLIIMLIFRLASFYIGILNEASRW